LYERGNHRAAADLLLPIASTEPLARRFLLDCLLTLDVPKQIISAFDPPQSPAEAIAVMDGLWAENRRDRLAEILKLNDIAESSDPSVVEMRDKYSARLKK
jgi:hypothetical protein